MKKSGRSLEKKLTISEIIFVVVITVLASFITLEIIFQNFADDLNLSPSLGGGLRTSGGSASNLGFDPKYPPVAPQGVLASEGEEQITISWDPVSGATSYEVYRASSSRVSVSDELIDTIDSSQTSVKDVHATIGSSFYYGVVSVNSAGRSPISQSDLGEVSATEGLLGYYVIDESEGFIPRSISVGNSGQHAFSHIGNPILYSLLFSSLDTHPLLPAPNYVHMPNTGTFAQRTASAKYADVHAALSGRMIGNEYVTSLYRFSSTSSDPLWEVNLFPDCLAQEDCNVRDVLVDEAGTEIFAFSYNEASHILSWKLLNANDGMILFEEEKLMPAGIEFDYAADEEAHIRISGDFSTAVIKSRTRLFIIDLRDGENLYSEIGQTDDYWGAVDISHSGAVVVIGGSGYNGFNGQYRGTLDVYERQTNGGYIRTHQIAYTPSVYSPRRLDLTRDGTTLAVADYRIERITVYDIASETILISQNIVGTDNSPKRVRLSENGLRVAVGTWGDVYEDDIDEIQVFSVPQNEALATFATGGSVTDLDFSPNGDFVAATVRNSHVLWFLLDDSGIVPEGGEILLYKID